MRSSAGWCCVVMVLAGTQASAADSPAMAARMGIFAYPPEGKSAEQIQQDDSHCYQWAVDYTGQDPLKVADQLAQQQPQQGRGGQVAGGAAAGAAAGVLIGDNRQSAATGAAIGAVAGGIARRHKQNEQQRQQQQSQQEADDALAQFRMGYSSCLKARGYGVN